MPKNYINTMRGQDGKRGGSIQIPVPIRFRKREVGEGKAARTVKDSVSEMRTITIGPGEGSLSDKDVEILLDAGKHSLVAELVMIGDLRFPDVPEYEGIYGIKQAAEKARIEKAENISLAGDEAAAAEDATSGIDDIETLRKQAATVPVLMEQMARMQEQLDALQE